MDVFFKQKRHCGQRWLGINTLQDDSVDASNGPFSQKKWFYVDTQWNSGSSLFLAKIIIGEFCGRVFRGTSLSASLINNYLSFTTKLPHSFPSKWLQIYRLLLLTAKELDSAKARQKTKWVLNQKLFLSRIRKRQPPWLRDDLAEMVQENDFLKRD